MWLFEFQDDFDKRRRKWPKKHKRELLAALNNLDTFAGALIAGQRPAEARFGFIHAEPMGVLAIDQKGGGPNLKETRLYIYPDTSTELIHVITIGDKDSQPDDIERCKAFMKELRCDGTERLTQAREKTHVQE